MESATWYKLQRINLGKTGAEVTRLWMIEGVRINGRLPVIHGDQFEVGVDMVCREQ